MTERTSRGEMEYVFYVYEDDQDDPRFSFWMEDAEKGLALYDRPPEGAGMWLDPEVGSDYEPTLPTDGMKKVVAGLVGDGIDVGLLDELPPHEEYFVRILHGTAEQSADAIPDPVWSWMHQCADEVNNAS